MIHAFIFDLDGTLVETELLKARSYAAISQRLLELPEPDARALALYEEMVGSTDEAVARAMIDRLGLLEALRPEIETGIEKHGDPGPWRALHKLRMACYERGFGTGDALRRSAYAHNISLLRKQKQAGRNVAVATSSFTEEAERVLAELGVSSILDAIIGRDRVDRGKPDPEIYLKTAEALGVEPPETVVIEDSPIGVTAAVAAGMACIAVANPSTAERLRSQTVLPQEWVVQDPAGLDETVERRIRAAAAGPASR